MQLGHREALLRAAPAGGVRPLLFVLDGVGDKANVAHVFRLAGSMGARVWLVETKVTPANEPGLRRLSRTQTDRVEWEAMTRGEAVARLGPAIAVEITSRSIPYPSLAVDPQGPLTLVAGAESEGVSDAMLEACAAHVHVPMAGTGSSLNVAMSLAIVAAHLAWVQPLSPGACSGSPGLG